MDGTTRDGRVAVLIKSSRVGFSDYIWAEFLRFFSSRVSYFLDPKNLFLPNSFFLDFGLLYAFGVCPLILNEIYLKKKKHEGC